MFVSTKVFEAFLLVATAFPAVQAALMADAYYNCPTRTGRPLEPFGSFPNTCEGAEACIEQEALSDPDDDEGGAQCWVTNPTCCHFGYLYGLKVEAGRCSQTGDSFELGTLPTGVDQGEVFIQCPDSKTVTWEGDIIFDAAYRKAANQEYTNENDLVCGDDADANTNAGTIVGLYRDTSHFDLCWNEATPAGMPTGGPTAEPSTEPSGAPTPSIDSAAPTSCSNVCLDFEQLTPGDYVTNQLEGSLGIVIEAIPMGKKGYAPNGAARIFDTSNPRADPDLGTPNESCVGGGPGVGLGGAPNSTYTNCEPLGNVLIIQEKDKNRPDDSRTGGLLVFDFVDPVTLYDVTILDIDDPNGASVEVMDVASASTVFVLPAMGDNGVYTQSVNVEKVQKMTVAFGGSGAVAEFCYALCA